MIATQLFTGALAFAITIALVPAVKALCIRYRLFDAPGPLKIHTQPIPRLGGVAIAFAICAAVVLSSPQRVMHAWPFLAALALIWTGGLADDLRGISPWIRLTVQFSAGALLWQHGWRLPILGGGALNFTVTVFYVAGFANSVNLLDGMDGLAAGVVGIISAAYLMLPGGLLSPFAVVVAWSLLGACAGFLIFNFPLPARVYMGDAGSTSIGLCLAFLGLDLYRSHAPAGPTLLFPLLAAVVPMLDTGLALIRRLLSRSPIFAGDRKHSYDLLSERGWPVQRIVFAFYGVTTVLAAIGLFGVRSESPHFWALAMISVGLLTGIGIRLGCLRGNDQNKATRHSIAHPTADEYGEPSQTN
jgi:UDP-GlcNAc:undecaprenyl-phosphate/decaprenyl-phosphate GlcNAc-1-phosphate transferase